MKKHILFYCLTGLCFISFLSIISCKNESENQSENTETVIKEESITFDIIVDIKIKKDDDLIIYYKDGSNQWIVEEKAVWNTVKGSNDFQMVVFKLPEDVIPNDFRFDIGRNEFKGQDPIEIRSISLNYLDNNFVVTQDMFTTFFRANQFLKYDDITKQFSLNKVEGNYDPYFEVTPSMYPQLTKLVLNN